MQQHEMQLVNVNVSSIKGSPFNPTIRTDRTTTKYKSLRTSIRNMGILSPVLITSDNTLIDGNRRFNVAKELGYEVIPAVMHNNNSPQMFDRYFLETNEHDMSINGAQYLERYLNGAVVPVAILRTIEKLKEVGGRSFLQRIANEQKSPNTYWITISMFRRYTMRKDLDKKLIYFMFNVESPYKVKYHINNYIPIDILVSAVKNGEKVTLDYKK